MSKLKNAILSTILILCLFSLLFINTVQAKNCLWEVKSDDNTLYIQGSVHLLKKENYPLKKPIMTAFNKSDILVFETDLTDLSSPEFQGKFIQMSMLLDGKTLKDMLQEDTYLKLSDALNQMGMDISLFNMVKPWAAVLSLIVLKLQAMGYDQEDGLDLHLYNLAQENNKQTQGLETIENHINYILTLEKVDQDEFILQTISDLEIMETQMDNIVKNWGNGNLSNLEKELLTSFKEYPEIHQQLLINRNNNWIPKIEQFLTQKKIHMGVVGAAHLIGKDGVIDILRKKGYKIKQL